MLERASEFGEPPRTDICSTRSNSFVLSSYINSRSLSHYYMKQYSIQGEEQSYWNHRSE